MRLTRRTSSSAAPTTRTTLSARARRARCTRPSSTASSSSPCFVGAYWNRNRLLAFYLFAMASLIALHVFAFAITRGSGAYCHDDYFI
jgi:hypothetical protein